MVKGQAPEILSRAKVVEDPYNPLDSAAQSPSRQKALIIVGESSVSTRLQSPNINSAYGGLEKKVHEIPTQTKE